MASDLRDDVAEVRNLREALTPLSAQIGDGPEDLVAMFLALVPLRGPVVGRLDVRVPGSPIHLAPGQTKMIEIMIEVPAELPDCGRLRGRVAVLTAIWNSWSSSRPASERKR